MKNNGLPLKGSGMFIGISALKDEQEFADERREEQERFRCAGHV